MKKAKIRIVERTYIDGCQTYVIQKRWLCWWSDAELVNFLSYIPYRAEFKTLDEARDNLHHFKQNKLYDKTVL